ADMFSRRADRLLLATIDAVGRIFPTLRRNVAREESGIDVLDAITNLPPVCIPKYKDGTHDSYDGVPKASKAAPGSPAACSAELRERRLT
ncbi:MAG: hypothetical protein AAFR01_12430, partial [Pseudomonadota bacterium]